MCDKMYFCRLCLDTTQSCIFIDVFDTQIKDPIELTDIIYSITGVRINEHETNFTQLCHSCLKEIFQCLLYKKQTTSNDNFLKEKFGSTLKEKYPTCDEIMRIARLTLKEKNFGLIVSAQELINFVNNSILCGECKDPEEMMLLHFPDLITENFSDKIKTEIAPHDNFITCNQKEEISFDFEPLPKMETGHNQLETLFKIENTGIDEKMYSSDYDSLSDSTTIIWTEPEQKNLESFACEKCDFVTKLASKFHKHKKIHKIGNRRLISDRKMLCKKYSIDKKEIFRYPEPKPVIEDVKEISYNIQNKDSENKTLSKLNKKEQRTRIIPNINLKLRDSNKINENFVVAGCGEEVLEIYYKEHFIKSLKTDSSNQTLSFETPVADTKLNIISLPNLIKDLRMGKIKIELNVTKSIDCSIDEVNATPNLTNTYSWNKIPPIDIPSKFYATDNTIPHKNTLNKGSCAEKPEAVTPQTKYLKTDYENKKISQFARRESCDNFCPPESETKNPTKSIAKNPEETFINNKEKYSLNRTKSTQKSMNISKPSKNINNIFKSKRNDTSMKKSITPKIQVSSIISVTEGMSSNRSPDTTGGKPIIIKEWINSNINQHSKIPDSKSKSKTKVILKVDEACSSSTTIAGSNLCKDTITSKPNNTSSINPNIPLFDVSDYTFKDPKELINSICLKNIDTTQSFLPQRHEPLASKDGNPNSIFKESNLDILSLLLEEQKSGLLFDSPVQLKNTVPCKASAIHPITKPVVTNETFKNPNTIITGSNVTQNKNQTSQNAKPIGKKRRITISDHNSLPMQPARDKEVVPRKRICTKRFSVDEPHSSNQNQTSKNWQTGVPIPAVGNIRTNNHLKNSSATNDLVFPSNLNAFNSYTPQKISRRRFTVSDCNPINSIENGYLHNNATPAKPNNAIVNLAREEQKSLLPAQPTTSTLANKVSVNLKSTNVGNNTVSNNASILQNNYAINQWTYPEFSENVNNQEILHSVTNNYNWYNNYMIHNPNYSNYSVNYNNWQYAQAQYQQNGQMRSYQDQVNKYYGFPTNYSSGF